MTIVIISLQDKVDNIFQRTQGGKTKESEINFYGILLSFTAPKLTRTGDWMMTINVFDDTMTNEASNVISSFTMTLFNKNKKKLPTPLGAGEIIRCHRIVSNVSLFTGTHNISDFHHKSVIETHPIYFSIL